MHERPESPMTTDPSDASSAVVGRALGPDGSLVLDALRQGMDQAREAVMAARRPPAGPTQLKDARETYLLAMLAYLRALSIYRLPVPPRLRDEVRLLRSLTAGADPTTVNASRKLPGAAWERSRHGSPRAR
jgi:hypothetical protein